MKLHIKPKLCFHFVPESPSFSPSLLCLWLDGEKTGHVLLGGVAWSHQRKHCCWWWIQHLLRDTRIGRSVDHWCNGSAPQVVRHNCLNRRVHLFRFLHSHKTNGESHSNLFLWLTESQLSVSFPHSSSESNEQTKVCFTVDFYPLQWCQRVSYLLWLRPSSKSKFTTKSDISFIF